MTGIPSILKRILETKAEEVAARRYRKSRATLSAMADDCVPARGFADRVRKCAAAGVAVIAEIKKASPSAGVIREDFEPARIASAYEQAGAACLSVLTDEAYFQGADRYLRAAREACTVPVLRKDFIIDPYQVYETRVLGADCLLLIVAALSPGQLQDLAGLAGEIGLDLLVEVHDEAELDTALRTSAKLVGVNNRDLHSFTTDLGTSERLRPLLPDDRILVTESGINDAQDVRRMQDAGISAFLVGEAFMRQEDPGAALRSLFFEGDR